MRPGTLAAIAALLSGCQAMLHLESPELETDAGIDAPPDSRPDGSATARSCPVAPAGCALFECAVSTSCYYVCNGAVKWSIAQSYCTQVGALTTVDAQAEQDCINAAAHPTNADPVWIGSYQEESAAEPAGDWKWAYGASPYTDWASFEPNDYAGDQDCVAMTSGGHWNDIACTSARRFVCELQ
jgi:hypothetical protein